MLKATIEFDEIDACQTHQHKFQQSNHKTWYILTLTDRSTLFNMMTMKSDESTPSS